MKQQPSLRLGDKVQHCHIILMPTAHDRAWHFIYKQKLAALPAGWHNPNATVQEQMKDWLGPQFEDVHNVAFYEGFVHVLLHDGTEYHYPNSEVARVKTFITQENSDAA